ncbi:arabinose efflux permease family protein [Caulobacter vibrioides OR37]|jgi:MFS family permease|uniref:Arabinose efflux permease family protein n=2 Tax=Caulobacteraceae TaxID=76892 RepID=R0D4W7_CAUVI|nr:arabinose efflux permease family protein [Caulobacter vibrioides OR37]
MRGPRIALDWRMFKRLAAPFAVTSARSLGATRLVVFIGFWATTLAQPNVLGRIPLQNLLKNTLESDRSAAAAFFFWIGAPWYLKPLIGALSDTYPLLGSRRASYLALGGLIAAAAWAALAPAAHDYGALLAVCMALNLAIVIASTAIGGYMVEIAQAVDRPGQLTSLRNAGYQSSWLISGLAGGYLGALSIGWTALAGGAVALLIAPLAWLMREPPRPPRATPLRDGIARRLGALIRARGLWSVALLATLYYLAPGLQTALFYLQQNSLRLDTPHQGYLTFCGGVGGVAAAAVYGLFAAHRFALRRLMRVCLAFGAGGILLYRLYDSFAHALVIETINGFAAALCEIVIIHAAVRATPRGSEALGFAVFMAVRNFFLFGSDWLGSALIDHVHLRFETLVVLNAGMTLLAALLAQRLPAELLEARDATKEA